MRGLAPLLGILLATPARAETLVGAVTGGGWDSNLSRSESGATAANGGYASWRAWLGGSLGVGAADDLSLELGWEGTLFPTMRGLDEHRPAVALGWLHELGDSLHARLGATAALRLARDRERSGSELGGSLVVRWRALAPLSLRLSGSYLHRSAGEAAYAGDAFRVRGAMEWDTWRKAFVAFAYAADFGDDTFYAPPAGSGARPGGEAAAVDRAAGGLGRGGRQGTAVGTFGEPLVAYRASRVEQVVSADLTQGLPGGFFIQAGWSLTWVRSNAASWSAHAILAEAGWRH